MSLTLGYVQKTNWRRGALPMYREFAAAGGLMSFGANLTDTHRLVGIYAGQNLKGDKTADLPVQQATTKVEMYINLKTARALGITITLPLSGRADEIFE
jgi:putative ABC transport system substrate-binding protein